MAISEVPSSPGDTSRRLFPAKNKKKRKKAKGTKRPPVQLRFMLSPLPKRSSASDQSTASKGHRGEASPTTAPVETVIESEEEEETAEPELQTCPVPSKLYDISGAHNPYWYKFIKLVPRPEFEYLHKPGNKHARAAYCTKCSAEVHFEKGRSHVKMHLQVHHPAYFRDCEKRKKAAKDAKVTIASGALHSTPSKKKRIVAVTPEQQRRANQYLALWIAKNMRPLVIVEDEGLAFYVRCITETLGGISLKVPGRTQVRVDIVQLAVELRTELKGMIKEGCRYYAVTTDIWTSLTTEGYVSLTLHYLDLKFRPCNWTLEIERFPGIHSGEAIAEGLTKLFKRWGLDPSFCIKLVRDGASNGVLAGNLMGVPHMSCIAHSLHLVVGGALIKRTRKASGVANRSGLVTESAPESPQRLVGAAAALAATASPGVAVNPASLVLPAPPGAAGGPVGPVLPAPLEIAEQVAVPCEDDAKCADTEAEPWEQDRSIQELADFLRQWHVMEQLYALDEVRDLVQRFRSLATYFHSSQKATSCLNVIQKRLIAEDRTGEDELHTRARQPLKVVTDCPTRWNSARNMLARMIELKQPLKVFFRHLKTAKGKKEFQRMPKLFQPDAKDWFTVKCLIALLDPIAATSELLGGQGYPTLALAFPCLRQIERTLNRDDLFDEEALLVEDAPFKQTVLDLMTTVRLAFVGLFERRFADLPTDLLWISYLDPRLTNMEGLTNDQCKEATTGLIDAAIAMAKQENLNQSQPPQPDKDSSVSQGSSIPKKQRTTAVEGVFGKKVRRDAHVSEAARERRLKTRCSAEVYRYLDEVADTEFDADPLEWWRLHGRSYPYLAPLARQWLACVATSVPSERAFSSAGNIVNCKRTKLDPSLVRDLLFIHDNFEFPGWEMDEEATSDPSHVEVIQNK